jgi:hypothetical protein
MEIMSQLKSNKYLAKLRREASYQLYNLKQCSSALSSM